MKRILIILSLVLLVIMWFASPTVILNQTNNIEKN